MPLYPPRLLLATLVFLGLCLSSRPCSALVIEAKRWNLANSVDDGRFNRLSLKLYNDRSETYSGPVELSVTDSKRRVVRRQRIVLGQGARRWLHWTLPVTAEKCSWQFEFLSTNRKRSARRGWASVTIDAPERTQRTQLVLRSSGLAPHFYKGLESFDESQFPSTLIGLAGLHQVIVDHPPEWTLPQQQCLLNWIALGGQLHILQQSDGRHPSFQGSLTPLNGPDSHSFFGQGMVIRHPRRLSQWTPKSAAELGFPKFSPSQSATTFDQALSASVLRSLHTFQSQPSYNWRYIYGVLLAYIIWASPLHFYFAQRRRRVLATYLPLIFGVLFFGGLTYVLTYSDRSGQAKTISMSLARRTHNGYLVRQWTHHFQALPGRFGLEFQTPGAMTVHDRPKSLSVDVQSGAISAEFRPETQASWERSLHISAANLIARCQHSQKLVPTQVGDTITKVAQRRYTLDKASWLLGAPGKNVIGAWLIDKSAIFSLDSESSTQLILKHRYQVPQATVFEHLKEQQGMSWGNSKGTLTFREDRVYELFGTFNWQPLKVKDSMLLHSKNIALDYSSRTMISMLTLFAIDYGRKTYPKEYRQRAVHVFILTPQKSSLELKNWGGQQDGLMLTHVPIPRTEIIELSKKTATPK